MSSLSLKGRGSVGLTFLCDSLDMTSNHFILYSPEYTPFQLATYDGIAPFSFLLQSFDDPL